MGNKTELILIRISGVDRPGLTASVTAILSKYQVDIMDIGQADIHSTLSLGILFKCSDQDSGNIMKELLFKASDLVSISASILSAMKSMKRGSTCKERTATF